MGRKKKFAIFHVPSCLRRRIVFIALISIVNFLFGIYVVASILSINKPEITESYNVDRIDILNEPANPIRTERKNEHDYYFRIDYTVTNGVCQPLDVFNTTETINSIENITNQRINRILSRNIQISLQVLRVNAKLVKPAHKLKARSSKLVCDYLLELFVGIDFLSYCNDNCRSVEIRRLISDINVLDNSALKFSVRKQNSKGSLVEYNIQNIVLFQTVKYLEQIVFIQTVEQNRYMSITILDSNAFQTSVSMSKKDKSLFIIKNGLVSCDPSTVCVSIAALSSPNLYLRHQDGRITLNKDDQTDLFRQDATFKFIYNHRKDLVAFQAVNLKDFYLALDTETNTSLILKSLNSNLTIDTFYNRFLFKIITKI